VEKAMSKATFDPGFTQKVGGQLRRAVNRDGSFNVRRRQSGWRRWHPYLYLVNMSWPGFFGLVFVSYFMVNTMFAVCYLFLGPEALHGGDPANHFLNAFFFSAHTLTTVGYGTLAPSGIAANFLAALEALMGLMGFAVATGLLFGRVSRPSARLRFSDKMLMAPYQTGSSLQFRIVNLRPNVLMELEASMLLMTVEGPQGNAVRRYHRLTLEREKVYFLPLTWTIVHPIDENSPLKDMTTDMLEGLQAEFLILIKGYDDTFSQTVHRRFSYRFDEIVWNARFTSAFDIDAAGDVVLDVDKVGAFAEARDILQPS
jgi:inward rectifier potassium channel